MKRSISRLLTILFILFLFPVISLWLVRYTAATEVPFLARQTVESNFNGARAAYAADIDQDGDLDIVSAGSSDNTIAWWENTNGLGTIWNTHILSSTFVGAIDAVPTDLDGDGDLDILGAAILDDDITWWENTAGDGSTWAAAAIDLNFDGVYDLHPADVDQDGDVDFVGAASVANEVAWWENVNGDATSWSKQTVNTTPVGFASAVYTADIDGDGDEDIISAAGTDQEIAWWENRLDTAQPWVEHTVNTTPFDLGLGVYASDVDSDGDTDILGAAFNDNTIAWWENVNGDGTTWSRHTINDTFSGAKTVYTTDLDDDGDIDVLGTGINNDTVAWWENITGDGTTWQMYTIDSGFDAAYSVEAADMNGDGNIDVLASARDAGDLAWWNNDTIHKHAIYPQALAHTVDGTFDGAYGVHANDIDGDGDMDMLGVAANINQVAWWENTDGAGTFGPRRIIDSAFSTARSLTTADVDDDGDLDVLAAAVGANTIAWWENTNGDASAWTRRDIDTGFTAAFWVDAADVDGDGDTDVLGAASFGGHMIAWWENADGAGTSWNTNVLTTTFTTAVGVHAADVDGDGDTDILGASYGTLPTGTNGRVTWWENLNGDGSAWTAQDVDSNYLGAVSVYAADIDGDSDLDVVGSANVAEEFTWWENVNGDGSVWVRDPVGTGFANAESAYAADLDDDGDIDILGGSQNDNTVAWWENTAGDGSMWLEHIVDGNFLQAVHVYAADINANGRLDILGAGAVADDIVWWENGGGQFNTVTTNTAPIQIYAGLAADVLMMAASHNGLASDNDVELATLELLFEETVGDPLTTAEANNLIDSLSVYLDDGSGTFEVGNDTLVTTIGTLTLTDGRQTVFFSDGDVNVRIQWNVPRTYFVVVQLTGNAHSQSPNSFYITHLTDRANSSISSAEDRSFDVPLIMSYAPDVSAVTTAVPGLLVSQSVTPADALPGQFVTYAVDISNNTTSTITDIIITDTLPFLLFNISYDSDLPLTPGGTPNTWTLSSLAPDAGGTLTITAQVSDTISFDAVLTNEVIMNGLLGQAQIVGSASITSTVTMPRVQFTAPGTFSVLESTGTATATIMLDTPNPYASVQVQVATTGGTATAGDDYIPSMQLLTIAAGETSTDFTISIIDDMEEEESETIDLTLTSPVGAIIGPIDAGTITIIDNESAQYIFLPFIVTP